MNTRQRPGGRRTRRAVEFASPAAAPWVKVNRAIRSRPCQSFVSFWTFGSATALAYCVLFSLVTAIDQPSYSWQSIWTTCTSSMRTAPMSSDR